MRLVAISDTHNFLPELPHGDVLIHCGDATMRGTEEEVERFDTWLSTLKFSATIFVPGNHDFLFKSRRVLKNATVLINEAIEIGDVTFWCSPYTPTFGNWAFMKREDELAKIWEQIPDNADVIITHGPPQGMLDRAIDGRNAGSQSLLDRIREIKPKIHVFGHIHEAYGEKYNREVRYVNSSIVNEYYQNVNKPVVVDL